MRSKEGEVVVLEHERDNMRRELEEAREEMKSLQEAIEEKREELGSLEEVQTALAIREEVSKSLNCLFIQSLTGSRVIQLRQAKEAASVQDELVGFLQNRLAEVELGAAVERTGRQACGRE